MAAAGGHNGDGGNGTIRGFRNTNDDYCILLQPPLKLPGGHLKVPTSYESKKLATNMPYGRSNMYRSEE